jgi:hypothetical protein
MPNERKELPHITLMNLRPPYDDFDYFADSAGHPFRHDATAFELVNAWWLCEAATLSYSDPQFVRDTFQKKTVLQDVRDFSTGGGTQCFVASNDDFAIVAFRGTETSPRRGTRADFREVFADLLADADVRPSAFGPGASVHHGFSAAVDEVWEGGGLKDFIAGLASRTIWFTGHSLGAALATLAAVRSERLNGLYTFGSPRVGNGGFADAFKRVLADKGVEYFRFVNNKDVVTTLPPRGFYTHVGTLRHIDVRGQIHESSTLFERLSNEVRNLIPFDGTGALDPRFFNLIPNALEDHVPTLYAMRIWNAYADESND